MRQLWLLVIIGVVTASLAQAPPRLRVDGRRMVTTTGEPFEWRGVTAFRLIGDPSFSKKRRTSTRRSLSVSRSAY